MNLDVEDTICALASAPGGAVRGIVRVSGPDCLTIVAPLVGPRPEALAAASGPHDLLAGFRSAKATSFRGAKGDKTEHFPDGPQAASGAGHCFCGTLALGDPLGEIPATIYVWPTTRSYTRQPSIELHLPGSVPILDEVLAALCRAGARLARPGEFTLRAFLAGRLDLTQAEAVLGVIDAQSGPQLAAALAQLAGGLAQPLHKLREELLDLLAHLEAGLDFVEEDIEFIASEQLAQQLAAATQLVEQLEAQLAGRARADSLPRVVLVGPPNAGKSSLLNALAGETIALVSDQAGTTRDFVARPVRIGGYDVLITDTAGVAAGGLPGSIAAAAQVVTERQAKTADVTLLCHDSSQPLAGDQQLNLPGTTGTHLTVLTKCDLVRSAGESTAIRTSSLTGAGLAELRHAIVAQLDRQLADATGVLGTAARCRDSLRLAGQALERARAAVSGQLGEELVAAEIRGALEELGRVVGAVYTDDILDRVFSRFCIGK